MLMKMLVSAEKYRQLNAVCLKTFGPEDACDDSNTISQRFPCVEHHLTTFPVCRAPSHNVFRVSRIISQHIPIPISQRVGDWTIRIVGILRVSQDHRLKPSHCESNFFGAWLWVSYNVGLLRLSQHYCLKPSRCWSNLSGAWRSFFCNVCITRVRPSLSETFALRE